MEMMSPIRLSEPNWHWGPLLLKAGGRVATMVGWAVHMFLTFGLPLACVAPLFLLNATETDN